MNRLGALTINSECLAVKEKDKRFRMISLAKWRIRELWRRLGCWAFGHKEEDTGTTIWCKRCYREWSYEEWKKEIRKMF